MHFSIPDTQEFIDNTGAAYTGYNIHINGLFHCTLRYKQLLSFHEQLSKEFDIKLPIFPSKKLFPLTINQQEERRICLEKYIQIIGQNSMINNCELLNGFLINAQQETSNKISLIQDINIYMFNNDIIKLKISTSETTTSVLKKALRTINLNNNNDYLFTLYIIDNNNTYLIRKLQNFESPILTMDNINIKNCKFIIGKNYWDVDNDIKLMNDQVSLDLLYIQTISEIERDWIKIPHDYIEHVDYLKSINNKIEYINIIKNFKYYGYIQFSSCYCDYPKQGTKVIVAIGKNELCLRKINDDDVDEDDEEDNETIFKVTRMRCWRITTLHNSTDKDNDDVDDVDTSKYSLELSFEYLVAKNQLQWVTISSEQAILMSISLQGMIDELLIKKTDDIIHQKNNKTWTYIMRNGQKKKIIQSSVFNNDDDDDDNNKKCELNDKKTNKNINLPVKIDKRKNNDCDIMENNAFYMIGDDDL